MIEPLDLGDRLWQEFNVRRPVDLLRDRPDLVLDGEVQVVEELEVARGLGRPLHGLGQVDGTSASLGPVPAEDRVEGAGLLGQTNHLVKFLLSVSDKDVDGNNHRDPEGVGVLNLFSQVAEAGSYKGKVALRVLRLERGAGHNGRTSAVHLQRPHRRHQDNGMGHEAGVAALDVEELLHPDVGSEARLCHHKAVLANQLETDLVREDRRVAMGDVGKRPSVDKDRGALEGLKYIYMMSVPSNFFNCLHLHQVGSDGILHEDGESSSHSKVLGSDRVSCPAQNKLENERDLLQMIISNGLLLARRHDHLAQALPHVCEAGREGQDCHDLTGQRGLSRCKYNAQM